VETHLWKMEERPFRAALHAILNGLQPMGLPQRLE